jgi:hypothetical protein
LATEKDIERLRRQRRKHIEEVAPLVDARLKEAALTMPNHVVGEWRGKAIVDTAPPRYGAGKPITAAELARYTVVFANEVGDEVSRTPDGVRDLQSKRRPQQWRRSGHLVSGL